MFSHGTTTVLRGVALVTVLLASGCTSRLPGGQTGEDGGVTGDAADSTTKPDAQRPLGEWRFVSDDEGGAAEAVALRAKSIDGNSATIEVTLRGVPQLQGVAFRLGFPAERVTVKDHERSPAWSDPNVAEFAVRPEGEIWGGIGHVGAWGISAERELVVATLQLELSGSEPIDLAFDAPRAMVLSAEDGRPVEMTWLGGRFQRQ